ncbi:MAG TPA: toxin-antitoxin system HicB family antitoxin [Acidimicrobiia bacterium]|nr:toxin-antitoxin system HicB family antitoxin [Acidimicrobiia bacterium]
MHLEPVMTALEAAVSTQLAVAGADPTMEAAAGQLLSALEPALRQVGLELAQQAAEEVGAQLGDRNVEVLMVDGEPQLRVTQPNEVESSAMEEDFDARITLRLPPSLKGLVESAADETGDSVNTWVVKTLTSGARKSTKVGRTVRGSFDL